MNEKEKGMTKLGAVPRMVEERPLAAKRESGRNESRATIQSREPAGKQQVEALPMRNTIPRDSSQERESLPDREEWRMSSGRRRRVIDDMTPIDFKNVELLSRFLSETGRILPRRMTGNSLRRQRELARAIKRARHLALLPFAGSRLL
jgi:small subunit ribosomal protein S18